MEKMRRVSQGRLAEIFGELVLGVDQMQRTLGIWRVSKETYELMSEEEQADL
jgi:acyl-homoserine lactone acylase PvdQ